MGKKFFGKFTVSVDAVRILNINRSHIPKQQASSKFLFCPTKYVKKQVLFIDLGFFYQSIGDFAESDKNKKSMIEFSSYACNMIFYANIHSIYDEKEYLVLLFFLNICKEFTSIKIKVR